MCLWSVVRGDELRNPLLTDEINVWVACGVGRTVRLAKKLGTTHNAVSVMVGKNWHLSDKKIDEIKEAIKLVEIDEVSVKKHVENIVLKSTALTFHHEKWIRDQAKKSLKKFALIYLAF